MEPGVAYLEIALRLRRLAPWLVEGYIGPSELVAAVEDAPPEGAAELSERVRAVREALADACVEADRRRWLDAQLKALETVLAVLAGEPLGYRQLVERCHGVMPTFVPEADFAAAHAQLAEVLPGSGDVSPLPAMGSRPAGPARALSSPAPTKAPSRRSTARQFKPVGRGSGKKRTSLPIGRKPAVRKARMEAALPGAVWANSSWSVPASRRASVSACRATP